MSQASTALHIRAYQPGDETAVINLWRRCGLVRPANDPAKDIRRKLAVDPELLLVGLAGSEVVAAVMVGYDGHRGWINYLAVDPDQQRHGYGRQIMTEVERLLRLRGCAKINLQVRTSNLAVVAFYQSLGFVEDPVISLGKRLEFD